MNIIDLTQFCEALLTSPALTFYLPFRAIILQMITSCESFFNLFYCNLEYLLSYCLGKLVPISRSFRRADLTLSPGNDLELNFLFPAFFIYLIYLKLWLYCDLRSQIFSCLVFSDFLVDLFPISSDLADVNFWEIIFVFYSLMLFFLFIRG